MLFPVSGVETNPAVPFLVALVVSFFTSMGGVSGAFLLLPFQVSVLGLYQPGGQPHQPGLQCCRHPQRRLSLYPGRPHGLAVNLGGNRGNAAGRLYRRLPAHQIPAGSQGFQALCRHVCCSISVCASSMTSGAPAPSMKALEAKFNERVAAMKQSSQSRVAAGTASRSSGLNQEVYPDSHRL